MSNTGFSGRRLINSAATRRKMGDCSDMWLWRRLHDQHLNFPRPIVINRRRYWDEAELDAWIEAQREGEAA